jgi:hypothetical protein
MSPQRRIRSIASGLFAAALLCTTAATAQAIHKHIDGEGRVTYSDQQPARSALSPSPRRGARQVEMNEAARRLKQAQLARSLGAEPRPGERTAGAGAGSVNYRYWQRQEKLRHVVEQAQRRSNEVRDPLVASR